MSLHEKFLTLDYNFGMKRVLLVILFMNLSLVFAAQGELSKQATAFYSDNNHHKTMDLILQINERDRTAQDWLLLGNVLADNGEDDNAAYNYQKAVLTDKKCYRAYYNLGNYYMKKGLTEEAINNYKKAINIKADNPYIFYNLGCAYLKKEDLRNARANFNKALMYKSDIPECHYNLAYIYQKQGKEKLASTYMDNYKKLTEDKVY